MVVLPRSPLYTEQARAELEKIVARTKKIEIDLGVLYRLHALGDGKLIIYDLPENLSMAGEALSSWQTFLTAILSVAEVQGYCRMSDSRLASSRSRRRAGARAFRAQQHAPPRLGRHSFPGRRLGLGSRACAREPARLTAGQGAARPTPANRFSLDVPPCGILPLAVDGTGMHEARLKAEERRQATLARGCDSRGSRRGRDVGAVRVRARSGRRMELTYDWQSFQGMFYPKRRSALRLRRDVPLSGSELASPAYLVTEGDTVVAAFAEGEDLSDWIGAAYARHGGRDASPRAAAF